MQLPGLTVTFTPREHQTAAVARIVSEPAVLLAHEVGAGKTAEMVIGSMELRRLGMASKPAVVVPNHMLEQFSREWMQLYPQARILAASIDDLGRDKRRMLVARIATGDWDAVILSRSAFERIPLSVPAQQRYLDGQLSEMRRQIEAAKGGHGLTVKRLEGTLARAEERLKALTDTAKDPGITFEETGIDYVIVDEAHGYKNLRTVSNIQGAAVEGSQRASDLDMKLDYLRERHGTRVATFATATPIANSVSEAFTMQRFLRPDLLDAAGLTDFDTWAATFGEVTTNLELAPDGSRFKMQSRFAKFRNVPELLRMWHVSADIKTAEDLQLPTPDLRGGRAETVVVPASEQLAAFMGELSERADKVQSRAVPPEEDNMLKVATHGRMAALDLRLLGRAPGEDTKLAAAATRIAAIHRANADRAYPGSDVSGSLQIVFCDLGTPSARSRSGAGLSAGWNAYDEVKALLVARGVPAEQIRYVHEARNDKEKGELFAAARNGRISVLHGLAPRRWASATNVQRSGDRPAPPRLPVAACRHRPARGPHPAAGEFQPRGRRRPVRLRRIVRCLPLADRRTQSPLHRPGHARLARRPRDRGHRRHRPVLQRGQSPGHRRPPHPGKGPRRRRTDPPRAPGTRPRPQSAHALGHHRQGRQRRPETRRHPRTGRGRHRATH